MSLRTYILKETGQDIRRCQGCASCNLDIDHDILDVPLESMIQMIILNDDEILTSRTVWSEIVVQAARYACQRNLNLSAIILALRAEAQRRGLEPD